MLRSECTSKKLKEIGFEVIPRLTCDEYVTPLKDVAYLLREEGYDCKVEIDFDKTYTRTTYATFEARNEILYNFEYLYIREHGTSKWQMVARREHVISSQAINKALD